MSTLRSGTVSSRTNMTCGNIGADDILQCYCGLPVPLKTCSSRENRGRRYWGCSKYGNEEKYYKFFKWFDKAIPDQVDTPEMSSERSAAKSAELETLLLQVKAERDVIKEASKYLSQRCTELEERIHKLRAEAIVNEMQVNTMKKSLRWSWSFVGILAVVLYLLKD